MSDVVSSISSTFEAAEPAPAPATVTFEAAAEPAPAPVTLICFALDKSGSMGERPGVASTAISATNEFMGSQAQLPGDTRCALLLFNGTTQWVSNAEGIEKFYPIQNYVPLTAETYVPSGMTALYDAIEQLITAADLYIVDHPEQTVTVIIAIQTDGQENSSTRVRSSSQLAELITTRRAQGWQFTFLGADQDACLSAARIGISGAATISYTQDAVHTDAALRSLSHAVSRYRSMPAEDQRSQGLTFTADEQQAGTQDMGPGGNSPPASSDVSRWLWRS